MCKSAFHNFLQALPKCEHHLHLEGALTPTILFQLAAQNNIALPVAQDPAFTSPATLAQRYASFTSLDDFLHYYYIGMSVLITSADFEALAWDYFQHAAADGVVHAEVFFDPQAHLARGIPYDVVLAGFSAARRRAAAELRISSELICCFLRHLPVKECEVTFALPEVRASFARGDVVGIGLDSSEMGFPPELFEGLYRDAEALGVRRTAHAGEEGPAAYVATSVDVLRVERIDHGIRLADDPALMARLAHTSWNQKASHANTAIKQGATGSEHLTTSGQPEAPSSEEDHSPPLLTVCPLSNVFLNCVPNVAALPIRKFLDAGVRFSLNSDDPAYFGNNYLLANYCAVQDAFGLSIMEWHGVCKHAIRGSWCGYARKVELLARLERVVEEWRHRLEE